MKLFEILNEGGKATADLGTVRANKSDIETALSFVAKALGLKEAALRDNLLGSTNHTLTGAKKDSGDIDIAFQGHHEEIVKRMQKALQQKGVKIGNNTFSFAVPTTGSRKVQVDLMFVPSEQWAKWMYHSDIDSKHKGKIRNALLRAVAANAMIDGEDVSVEDEKGNTVVRVRKSLKNDEGLIRLFKVAPLRKDGKGRTKSLQAATPEEVATALQQLGVKSKFKKSADQVLDPDAVAAALFGSGTKSKDLMSTEQVIKKILKMSNAKKIVNDAIGNEMDKSEVPEELRSLVD